jgi:hypothetical protein
VAHALGAAADPPRLRPASDQTEADWLAAEYDAGWVPEYGHGIPIELNGGQVHRWAMIEAAAD